MVALTTFARTRDREGKLKFDVEIEQQRTSMQFGQPNFDFVGETSGQRRRIDFLLKASKIPEVFRNHSGGKGCLRVVNLILQLSSLLYLFLSHCGLTAEEGLAEISN